MHWMGPEGLSRREFLARCSALAAASAPLAGALLTGCTENRTAADLAQRLIVGIDNDIRTLDPAYQVTALDGSILVNIQENLTWFDHNMKLAPRLATSWESPDNGKTWLFKLRQGVKFHDGTDFNAEAVKFHFDRLVDPKTGSNKLTRVQHLAGTDILDEFTVRFRMKRPLSVWPVIIRDPFGCIESPTAVRKFANPRDYTRHPVGTGPFMFGERIPEKHILLRRNPNYWAGGVIKFEELEFQPVRENTTRLILLEQGKLDIADLFFAHAEVAQRSKRVVVDSTPWLSIRYIGLNNMKPPFNDVRVRRAANYAINRDEIVKYAFRGNADPSYGPLPERLPCFNREMETYHYDPDRARALLHEAGYPSGLKVVMWAMDAPTDRAVA